MLERTGRKSGKRHRVVLEMLPVGIAEVFGAEQHDLAAAGNATPAARPGDPMPDGELLDVRGQAVTLAGIRDERPGR